MDTTTTNPTPATPATIDSASLHFCEGASDKVYLAAIEPRGDGYAVTFAYGRRGSALTTGTKNHTPVPLDQARGIFGSLVRSKLAKGYQHSGSARQPYAQTGEEGQDTGIRPQLLNPVDHDGAARLIASPSFCLQEKHDGRRLLVRRLGDDITGINRRGLAVALPGPIREAVASIPHDVLIDGEAIGDALHAFDLLGSAQGSLRGLGYLDRLGALRALVPDGLPGLLVVATAIAPEDKRAAFQALREAGAEGVVFKHSYAPHSPGRPSSGGTQLKFKFVEGASFIVAGHNPRRSVTLGLYGPGGEGEGVGEGDTLVPAGNVTIPANHQIPAIGQVVEVRYLYAFRGSGSIYQPVYQGTRDDIPAAECVVGQLKYKADPPATAP